MSLRTLAALGILLALAPAAAAGSAEAPEVTDPTGDGGPNGSAAPGHDDPDIVAAWFENENAASVDLMIQRLAAQPARVNWDIGQNFKHRGIDYFAGGFSFVGDSGVYLCKAPSAGEASCLDAVEGSSDGATIRITIPKSFAENATTGEALELARGWSLQCPGIGVPGTPIGLTQCAQFDTTDAGLAYALTEGKAAPNALEVESDPAISAESDKYSKTNVTDSSGASAPGFTWIALVGAVALAIVVARRR